MSMRTSDMTGYTQESGEPDVIAEENHDSFSVIDRHSIFDGTFQSSRDLRIEGEVKGTIECKGTLFVAQGATVSAKVEAENIAVAGDLNGDIRCRGRLQMMPSGRVRGKVATTTLVINEGAYYEGQLEMTAPENRPASVPPRQLQSVTAPSPLAAPPTTSRSGSGGASETAGGNTFIRRLGGPETAWDNRSGEDDGEIPPVDVP